MTETMFMSRAMSYFGGDGKYNPEVIAEMNRIVSAISEPERDLVYDCLVEDERASFRIGVKEIVAACQKLGVGYRRSHYIPATGWCCDACGHQFNYAPYASDEDKLAKGIHDVCPMCGFQPGWTETYNSYKKLGRLSANYEAQYRRLIESCTQAHGPNAPGGVYWSRAAVEKELRDAKYMKIDRAMESVAKAKEIRSDAIGRSGHGA